MKHLRHILSLGMLIVLVSSASAQSWLTNGLVAHWKLDGDANDAVGNSSGNAQNVQWVTKTVGTKAKTVAFLGGESGIGGINIPNKPALNLPSTGYTLTGWVMSPDFSVTPPPNTFFTLIASQGIPGVQESAYILRYGPQGLEFQDSTLDNYPNFDPGYVDIKFYKTSDFSNDVLAPNIWHLVTVTYDGQLFRGYVNDEQLNPSASTYPHNLLPKNTGRPTSIGMQGDGSGGGQGLRIK